MNRAAHRRRINAALDRAVRTSERRAHDREATLRLSDRHIRAAADRAEKGARHAG